MILAASDSFSTPEKIGLFLALVTALCTVVAFMARAREDKGFRMRDAVLIYVVLITFVVYLFFLSIKK